MQNKYATKCKGLKNGRDWEYGIGKSFDDGLAFIHRGDTRCYVFKDSLSLYTGFNNSIGQEIYEGDLLEAEIIKYGFKFRCIQQVVWDQVDRQWKVEYFIAKNKTVKEALDKDLDKAVVGHTFTHEYLIKLSSELQNSRSTEKAY